MMKIMTMITKKRKPAITPTTAPIIEELFPDRTKVVGVAAGATDATIFENKTLHALNFNAMGNSPAESVTTNWCIIGIPITVCSARTSVPFLAICLSDVTSTSHNHIPLSFKTVPLMFNLTISGPFFNSVPVVNVIH